PRREGQKRLFNYRDKGRIKLILQGKRFGFSLDEIRELLDLYYIGDEGTTQMVRTFEKAQERLETMIAQRDELTEAIGDLSAEMNRVREILAKRGDQRKAAE
ncbi:MAG: DNA-binding transcriptional MerR regulator, partial [Paracoccaceae bacterium]